MFAVIKLVNVHYYEHFRAKKVQFKTTIERCNDDRHYYIIDADGNTYEVSCEEGNRAFKELMLQHPLAKSIIVVDQVHKYHEITYQSKKEHFEVYVDEKFYCSCDTIDEVRTTVRKLRKAFAK